MDIGLKRVKKVLKKLAKAQKALWFLGEHAFFAMLIFIFISFIIGTALFYRYSYLAGQKELCLTESPLRFKESNYQSVLEIWDKKTDKFKEIQQNQYSNPFSKEESELQSESESELQSESEPEPEPEPEPITYTISKGENLWDLAEEYLGTGFRWNEITDIDGNTFPDWRAKFLQPGQKVIIPGE